MKTYPQRVRDSILPRSLADTLPEAFIEWQYCGGYHDNESADEVCELCGHEDLRYQFEIENRWTKKRLWVGSQCILQFNVAVYEDARLLSSIEAKKKLESLVQLMRLQSCLRALEALADAEGDEILVNALAYYAKNKKLTPKQAFVVFWRLGKHRIDHTPSFFRVSLKRKRHRADLREMSTGRVHLFWRALTSTQRRMAMELGHQPPSGG